MESTLTRRVEFIIIIIIYFVLCTWECFLFRVCVVVVVVVMVGGGLLKAVEKGMVWALG